MGFRPATEESFQSQVIDLARLYGWLVAHFRPCRTSKGWRTPVQADGAGFPDLILVRGPRVLALELKTDTGRVTPEQQRWLDAFARTPVECGVIRPGHWTELERLLRGE